MSDEPYWMRSEPTSDVLLRENRIAHNRTALLSSSELTSRRILNRNFLFRKGRSNNLIGALFSSFLSFFLLLRFVIPQKSWKRSETPTRRENNRLWRKQQFRRRWLQYGTIRQACVKKLSNRLIFSKPDSLTDRSS